MGAKVINNLYIAIIIGGSGVSQGVYCCYDDIAGTSLKAQTYYILKLQRVAALFKYRMESINGFFIFKFMLKYTLENLGECAMNIYANGNISLESIAIVIFIS